MKAFLCVALCVLVLTVPMSAFAEVHAFRETNGRSHVGTFQKLQDDKVFVRVRNKTSQLSFWSLSKADQQYVLSLVKSDPLVSSNLKPAEDPREWTDMGGNKTAARFVELKAGAIVVLVIDGKRVEFAFGNFSKADQDYVRSQVQGTASSNFSPAENPQVPNSIGLLPTTPQVPATSPPFSNYTTTGQTTPPTATPNFEPFLTSPTTQPSSAVPAANAPMQAASSPATSAPAFDSRSPQPLRSPNRVSPPNDANVAVYTCSSCNKQVPSNATESCPHCHVRFDYVENENGQRSYTTGGMFRTGRQSLGVIKLAIFVTIAACSWAGKKLMKW